VVREPVRASVEHEGWGATLLACQDEDGQWAGGAFVPAGFTAKLWEAAGQPWTATAFTFDLLRDLGLPPGCAAARRTVAAVGANARWDHAGEPFWDGEVEECINGRLVTTGSYFGVDMDGVIDRLLDQQMSDGGWNCERENGSVRGSFHTTINVLEGLLAAQTAHGGVQDITAARHAGEEFLLERRLFRRQTTGEPADPDFLPIGSSPRWEYDVLRGLHYCRAAALHDGVGPTREQRKHWTTSSPAGSMTAVGAPTGGPAVGSGCTQTSPASPRLGSPSRHCGYWPGQTSTDRHHASMSRTQSRN
jgi:hypothetical protein